MDFLHISNNKKGDIQQVFIFAVSTIVVVFVGFLVLNFVGVIGADVEDRVVRDFLDEIELDFNSVVSNFNSEALRDYRIPGRISTVVFTTPACADNDLRGNLSDFLTGHYLVVFDSSNQVLDFRELNEFGTLDGCFEIRDREFISLAFRNSRNQITVQDISP